MQVFGRRQWRALDALGQPASEKRQGTKSREVGAPSVPQALWGFGRRQVGRGWVKAPTPIALPQSAAPRRQCPWCPPARSRHWWEPSNPAGRGTGSVLPCSLDPCRYGLARLTLRRTNCGPTHKGLDPEAAVSAIVLSLGEGAHRERRVPAAPSREQSPIARLRSATAFSSL